MEEGKDFIINDDGSVTRLDGKTTYHRTHEDDLESEYSQLVYDMSHPERFTLDEMSAKAQRRAELHKTLGKDKFITEKAGKMLDAGARMREKLRVQLKHQQSGPNLSDIISQQKQNG